MSHHQMVCTIFGNMAEHKFTANGANSPIVILFLNLSHGCLYQEKAINQSLLKMSLTSSPSLVMNP